MKTANRHAQSIELSSFLSKRPLLGREQKKDVIRMVPEDVAPCLLAAHVEFVLAGAHGISGWMVEPRSTQDVDFLIRAKDKQHATDAILKKFPDLEIEKHPDVWRFKKNEQYLIDLMLTNAPLFKRVFTETATIRLNRRVLKVPKLEAALAMKFASMTGHYRNLRKKKQDAVDFMSVVERNTEINEELLRELGELVYPGGGADVLKYVEDVRAGRNLEI